MLVGPAFGRHGPAVVVVARNRVVVVDPSLAATVVAVARATVVDTGERTVVTVVEVAMGFSPCAGVDAAGFSSPRSTARCSGTRLGRPVATLVAAATPSESVPRSWGP